MSRDHRPHRARPRPAPARVSTVAAAAALGLALAATPAMGQEGYTLHLSAPTSMAVGQTVIIQASGSNPPTDFFTSWLDVHAIPTSVLSTCPTGYLNASQVASSTYARGGGVVANSQREDVDAAGNFSMPIAYTPRLPGRFLICAYTNDGATGTLTTASLVMSVRAAPAAKAGARPRSVAAPRVVRSGKRLVCNRGRWANRPRGYAYGWLVDGRRQAGASGRTLRVTRQLRGGRVQCRVVARNAAGSRVALSRALRIR